MTSAELDEFDSAVTAQNLRDQADRALDSGNPSIAFELYSQCLEEYGEDAQVRYGAALSAARIGSITVAENLLAPLLEEQLSDSKLRIDCLSLMGRLEKDRYARESQEGRKQNAALRSAQAYEAAYVESQDYYPGTNAATMHLLAGNTKKSEQIAAAVLPDCLKKLSENTTDNPWLAATLGELFFLDGEFSESAKWYRLAAKLMGTAVGNIASMRRQLRLLGSVSKSATDLLKELHIPSVVTVTGHMIDAPNSAAIRFPIELEEQVTQRIKTYLQEARADIAYCSVACGVDIIFAEQILQRNGEVHVYLPFAKQDFIETSVAFAGRDWVNRFEAVLAAATSVRYATNENYLGDDLLFSYNADVITGQMLLRSERLEVTPRFLAIYDFASSAPTGGSRATADSWQAQGFVVDRIDLAPMRDKLTQNPKQASETATQPSTKTTNPRQIHAMVFADVVGFSKLGEADTPHFFVGLLTAISELIAKHAADNEFKNTWGDGLFLVFNDLQSAASFALDLRDLVSRTDWSKQGLPKSTNIRIALHVGPVYPAVDPVLQCKNFFGSHVNQTARMEPITAPGSVFVSDQAAALIRFKATDQFACDYLGPAALPKDAGTIGLHRLRRRDEIE